MTHDIGILGGGFTGLFLAHFLGGDVQVLEAGERVGGLCQSFGTDGFLSDIGGHIMFSKDKEALAHEVAVLGANVRQGVRANKILYQGLHVKYPFENGIDALPKEDIADILHTFVENPHTAKPTNFREWMFHVFGDGLTRRYLLPYNEKIWKTDPSQMSLEWVDRVPRPPLRDLIKTAVGIPTEGYTHQLYFQYPDLGGFEAVPRALAEKLAGKITTGFRAAKVTRTGGDWVVTAADGQERRFRKLVATIPITSLLGTIAGVPEPVTSAARNLRFNSLRVVLIGLQTSALPEYTALYVPAPESLYHRVCYNQVFSPHLVPSGCQSVSCEITVSPGSDLDSWSDERLIARVVDDLHRDKIIDRSTLCYQTVHRERLAYVVYDHGYSERMQLIRKWASELDIDLAGRFAEFEYINTDACVRRALDLARRLRGGDIASEATIPKTWE